MNPYQNYSVKLFYNSEQQVKIFCDFPHLLKGKQSLITQHQARSVSG